MSLAWIFAWQVQCTSSTTSNTGAISWHFYRLHSSGWQPTQKPQFDGILVLPADEDHIIIKRANSFYYYFILTTLRNMKVVAEKRTITVSQQWAKLPKHNTTKLYYIYMPSRFNFRGYYWLNSPVSLKETLLLLLIRVTLAGLCEAKQRRFN